MTSSTIASKTINTVPATLPPRKPRHYKGRVLEIPRRSRSADDRHYLRALNAALDEIFFHAFDKGFTLSEFALRSGLHASTVARIAHRLTALPSHRTIWRLARTVGCTLMVTR